MLSRCGELNFRNDVWFSLTGDEDKMPSDESSVHPYVRFNNARVPEARENVRESNWVRPVFFANGVLDRLCLAKYDGGPGDDMYDEELDEKRVGEPLDMISSLLTSDFFDVVVDSPGSISQVIHSVKVFWLLVSLSEEDGNNQVSSSFAADSIASRSIISRSDSGPE